jgi:hypothetical protein
LHEWDLANRMHLMTSKNIQNSQDSKLYIRRFDDYDVRKRQEKVRHMHNMLLINWFPRIPFDLSFYSSIIVNPADNDFAIRCNYTGEYTVSRALIGLEFRYIPIFTARWILL